MVHNASGGRNRIAGAVSRRGHRPRAFYTIPTIIRHFDASASRWRIVRRKNFSEKYPPVSEHHYYGKPVKHGHLYPFAERSNFAGPL
jgi:hypothetical protein